MNDDPDNSLAWLNYYVWTERDNSISTQDKTTLLNEAIGNAQKLIGNSAHYWLMVFLQSGKTDSAAINHALDAGGDRSLVYPFAILSAVANADTVGLRKFCSLLLPFYKISPGISEYQHNALRSAAPDAIVYAQGIEDLVAMAMIMETEGIRKDVTLKLFRNKLEPGAYLTLTTGKDIIRNYANGVYSGLLLRNESKESTESNPLLTFDLSYFSTTDHFSTEEAMLYKNYLPSFLLYYRSLKARQAPEAIMWYRNILKIATQAGIESQVRRMLE